MSDYPPARYGAGPAGVQATAEPRLPTRPKPRFPANTLPHSHLSLGYPKAGLVAPGPGLVEPNSPGRRRTPVGADGVPIGSHRVSGPRRQEPAAWCRQAIGARRTPDPARRIPDDAEGKLPAGNENGRARAELGIVRTEDRSLLDEIGASGADSAIALGDSRAAVGNHDRVPGNTGPVGGNCADPVPRSVPSLLDSARCAPGRAALDPNRATPSGNSTSSAPSSVAPKSGR